MCDVDPHVGEVRSSLAHLGEHVARLCHEALVREHTTDAVGCPDVERVVAQHRPAEERKAVQKLVQEELAASNASYCFLASEMFLSATLAEKAS